MDVPVERQRPVLSWFGARFGPTGTSSYGRWPQTGTSNHGRWTATGTSSYGRWTTTGPEYGSSVTLPPDRRPVTYPAVLAVCRWTSDGSTGWLVRRERAARWSGRGRSAVVA